MVTDSPVESLVREGDLMLKAVVTELSQIPGVSLITCRDHRLSFPPWLNNRGVIKVVSIESQEVFQASWPALIQSCDAVWPIAPETAGILEDLCKDVEIAGKLLINSSSDAVHQTASKYNTVSVLAERGIAVVPTYRLGNFRNEFESPWVVKPDDGVGCEGIRIISNHEELSLLYSGADSDGMVIQPFIKGETNSLSVFFERGFAHLLSCNRQCIDIEQGSIKLTGCNVNAVIDSEGKFSVLANQIADAVPGLWGYAGVDLICTTDELLVLEVNPRLTTSYAGLGKALGINVADLILSRRDNSGYFPEFEPQNTQSVFISLEQS